ncbi:MAG: SGNH/GDSL hydrolase family protein, partial [Clostridia bacterium]|nr:SGNH/GDSL hydrolase family protein [Clostridia bacterium]
EYKGKEYNTRGGIYNTLKKLQNGEDITIGYLGGSITMQDSWRPYTTQWFEETYSGDVTEVNIGLSGTGADLAVCRIDQDVLVHNPDLVFIEYAVNGGAAKDMEGMILKIWEHDPTTDIIFVYTTQTSNYSTYKSGNLPQYPAIYEPVAEHYGIPSVFFGYQAFDLYDQEKLTLTGTKEEGKILYTQDGVHLTGDGGFLSAGSIARSVVEMEKTFNKETYTETNHTVPETTVADIPWSDAMYTDDWSKMTFSGTWMDCSLDENRNFKNFNYTGGYLNEFKKLFPKMQGTVVAGSSVTVKFKGTDIGVFEAGGQFSGQLKVNVDGEDLTEKLVLYHASYDSKLRHQYYFIDSLPYGEHTVTFTLDSEMPDKSSLQNKNPSDTTYQKNEFYLGKILMNGELLDINE